MTAEMLSIENALHGLDEFLREKITPAISDPYVAPMARLSSLLLRICANGVDDAAELRVEENAAIRLILREAAGLLPEPLSDQLRDAAGSTDPGLKISVLDEENRRLRLLLAHAQESLEACDGPAEQILAQRIWRLFEAFEAKRAPKERSACRS
jgi:hypothetical protein